MTTHLILAISFIVSIITIIIFFILDMKHPEKDYDCYGIFPALISVILGFVTIIQGFAYKDIIHYRELHKPLIEDVNNGYAKLIPYKCIKDLDTIIYYDTKWLGSNQDGERNINNK